MYALAGPIMPCDSSVTRRCYFVPGGVCLALICAIDLLSFYNYSGQSTNRELLVLADLPFSALARCNHPPLSHYNQLNAKRAALQKQVGGVNEQLKQAPSTSPASRAPRLKSIGVQYVQASVHECLS